MPCGVPPACSALKAKNIGSEMIGTGTVDAEALSTISQAILANPKISCIIGLGTTPTTVAPDAAAEAGRPSIPNGGFDTNPKIMKNIMDGKTTATWTSSRSGRAICRSCSRHSRFATDYIRPTSIPATT